MSKPPSKQENLDRIAGFAKLEAGWMNGEGEAISAVAIAKALELVGDGDYSYPTLEGGVVLEYGPAEVTIETDGQMVWWRYRFLVAGEKLEDFDDMITEDGKAWASIYPELRGHTYDPETMRVCRRTEFIRGVRDE